MRKIIIGAFGTTILVTAGVGAFQYLSPSPDYTQYSESVGELDSGPSTLADATQSEHSGTDSSVPMPDKLAPDDDTEVVLGIRVRKDRNCTVQLHYIQAEDGTVKEAYSCEPHTGGAQRPYQSYDIESLGELAYGDAAAAEELGRRVAESDPTLALEMMIRASALSADASPVIWLAQASYSTIAVNDVPQVESMKTGYVLNELAKRLGHTSADPSHWRMLLENADVSNTEIDGLNRAVDGLVSRMREIQLNVIGEATIGGNSNG